MASLFEWLVYFFLSLLLFLAAVNLLRSILVCRHRRRMVQLEEAIRNGTYARTLSRMPKLWEAYLGGLGGGGCWQLGRIGHGSGEKDIDDKGTNSRIEYWESIKPIYAGYAEPLTSVPYSGSAPDLTTSFPSPVSIPDPTPINLSAPSSRGPGDEEENQRTAASEVSTGTNTTTTLRLSLLTSARIFFGLNPNTSVPSFSSADNNSNSPSISADISMTRTKFDFKIPSTIRVVVLIAMPSPSSSSTTLSASLSPKNQPTTSRPLQLSSSSPSSPTKTLRNELEKQPLPHLEMGVADVVVMGRSSSEG